MGEIVGPRAITVGHLVCRICDAEIGRFPYWLMFEDDKEPTPVCRPCYRAAMCVEWLKLHHKFAFKEVEKP